MEIDFVICMLSFLLSKHHHHSFAGNIIDNYKPFRKYTKDDLQFGYKIAFEGLEEKMGEQKITPITKVGYIYV
jgi:hypothetical protein